MKINHKATALAGLLAILLAGCSATETTSDFGKISSTERGHSTDYTRSGEMGGLGFVHRY